MKVLRFIFVLLVVLAIGGYLVYTTYVPKMVTSSLDTGDIPAYVPEKYHPALKETGRVMREEVKELPEIMNRYNLSYEDLLTFAQKVENDEIQRAMEEIRKSKPETSGEAFDLVLQQISADLPASDKYRELFSEKISIERIRSEVDNMQYSELPLTVEIDLARRIGIQILKERKDEIERKIDSLQNK